MTNVFKPVGSEEAVNATPKVFGSKAVRVFNSSTGLRTVSVEDIVDTFEATINATANGTTLITLSSRDTSEVSTGLLVVEASDTSVVNTDIASEVVSVVNTSAFVVNVDIVIADGTTNLSVSRGNYTMTLASNQDIIIEKGDDATLVSNNDTDVLGTAVSIAG